MVAKAILTSETEEEARAKLNNMVATYSSLAAQNAENSATKMGILTKAKYYIMLLFGGKQARKTAMAELGLAAAKGVETAATGAATGAQWGLNAAMYACPLGWILLAIMAVIAALVAIAIAFRNASDAAKMEKLND
jgi:hypothetical protein